ncbi:MAG: hypothetical protein ACLFM7_13595 [Bacteroidales bacterium]
MTDKQENKRSMFTSIKNVLYAHNSIWAGIPAMADAYGKFENILIEIDNQSQIQAGNIKGITKQKQKEEDEMIQSTLEMATTVKAYASVIVDNELKDKVSYSPSDLRNSRDTVLKDICQNIHDVAQSVISELGDFGKTPEDLQQLQKEIDDYADILSKPRNAVTTRAAATSELANLFHQADELLKNQIDNLMVSYKASEPRFYTMYDNARKIVSLGRRSEPEKEEPEMDE